LDDGSWLASGENPERDTVTIVAKTPLESMSALRLEVFADDSLSSQGPGRAENGNFVLNELRVTAQPAEATEPGQPLAFTVAQADFSQDGYHVAGAIDGNPATGWAVMPAFAKAHVAVFELGADVQNANTAMLNVQLVQDFGTRHTIGRFRLSATNGPRPVMLVGLPEAITSILAIPADQRDEAQRAELAAFYRPLDAGLNQHEQAMNAAGRDAAESRLRGAQDLAWALLNSPAFLFNR
jgi:hypothetical protein